MRVKYFAWFNSREERREFISILNSSRTDIEAVSKLLKKYPEIRQAELAGVVDNFKKELNKNESK